MKLLERIYGRLLRESAGAPPDVSGLAAVVAGAPAGGAISTTIYDAAGLRDAFLPDQETGRDPQMEAFIETTDMFGLIESYIMGYVRIVLPAEPCWDAWKISYAAGPDLGKIVYGCAYATSPSGRLISDRENMTDKAISAWRGMAAKSEKIKKDAEAEEDPVEREKILKTARGALPLDNYYADKSKRRTPDFPDDDCELRKEEFLNYAYESEGWEGKTLEQMKSAHEALKADLISAGGKIATYAERNLVRHIREAGREFFWKNYKS